MRPLAVALVLLFVSASLAPLSSAFENSIIPTFSFMLPPENAQPENFAQGSDATSPDNSENLDNSEPENLVWYYAENLWAPAEVHSPFANRVFFINAPYYPIEGPPENMLGLADGAYCDLNGGQATVGFPNETRDTFQDYDVFIPPGTDLIIFDRGSFDLPNFVTFGFGVPLDADNDGMADNPSGVATYIGGAVSSIQYGSVENLNLAFFDMGDYGQLNPIPNNLFVSVDDAGDYDVDSFEIGFSVFDIVPPTSMALPFDGE
ncbi:MAG: hypothetical protein AB1476_00005, partial [Candidatus Hadarchaeota archaeon]